MPPAWAAIFGVDGNSGHLLIEAFDTDDPSLKLLYLETQDRLPFDGADKSGFGGAVVGLSIALLAYYPGSPIF